MIKKYTAVVIFLVVVIGGIAINQWGKKPAPLDGFAQCLKEKSAIFYGAFWCSHCQNQKKLFGSSEKYLPYIECSTPDGSAQARECREEKIEGYPTWEFADGSRESGELSLERLAEKTGCILPAL